MKHVSAILLAAFFLTLSCSRRGADDGELVGFADTNAVDLPKVRVVTLQRGDFPVTVISNGRLRATRKADLFFETSGIISSVNAMNGCKVGEGEIVAELGRPDLELSLASAKASVQEAEIRLYDYLVGQGYELRDTVSVPEDLLLQAKIRSGYTTANLALKRALIELDGTRLRAPFSGKIAGIEKGIGERAGQELYCSVIDDSSFDVDFPVMETEMPVVAIGSPVVVSPYSDRGTILRGKVTEINPTVSPGGQVSVRARVPSEKGVMNGMNVEITLLKLIPGQLVVPRTAIVARDGKDVLFTCTPDGRASWKYVRVLMTNGRDCSIVPDETRGTPFGEGDAVVVSGNLNLADGTLVTIEQ